VPQAQPDSLGEHLCARRLGQWPTAWLEVRLARIHSLRRRVRLGTPGSESDASDLSTNRPREMAYPDCSWPHTNPKRKPGPHKELSSLALFDVAPSALAALSTLARSASEETSCEVSSSSLALRVSVHEWVAFSGNVVLAQLQNLRFALSVLRSAPALWWA
jgi:hypothetical protein